jgi:type VI secretion system protein ImpK
MTLLELCEPLFQFICRLSRSARKGVRPELSVVRSDIKTILADMKSKSASDRSLVTQYEKVDLPLVFFVDFMVKESAGTAARQWQDFGAERKELAGDERFFDLLDETLKEPGDAASERLAVFYVCMGLGFTGWYTGQPEFLRRKMLEISARIRPMMDADSAARICPEAYEHVNTANLITPPGRKLVGWGIALIASLLLVFALNIGMYRQSRKNMRKSLDDLVKQPAHVPVKPGPRTSAEQETGS